MMPESFNPYHVWLGIPPEEQPVNHYRLLGITLFETSGDVISNAADQRMAFLRTFQSGKNRAASQTLLNEISAAAACLLVPEKKLAYDESLKNRLNAEKPVATASAQRSLPRAAPLPSAPAQPAKYSLPPAVAIASASPQPPSAVIPSLGPTAPAVPVFNAAASSNRQLPASRKSGAQVKLVVAGLGVTAIAVVAIIIAVIMSQPPQQIAKETSKRETTETPSTSPKQSSEPRLPDGVVNKPTPATSANVPADVVSPAVSGETPKVAPAAPEVPTKVDPIVPATVAPVTETQQPVVPTPVPAPPSVAQTPAPEVAPPTNAVAQPPSTPAQPVPAEPAKPTSKIPSTEQLAAARKLMVDTFGADAQKANDVESKRALAIKLIKLAEETDDDLAARYVLTDNARKLFVGAGDVSGALLSADKLIAWFALDASEAAELRLTTFNGLSDAALLNITSREELADRVNKEVTAAISENRLTAADEYSQLGLKVTRGLKELDRKRTANQQRTLVTKLKGDFAKYEQARETIKNDSSNPAANLIAGKYLCLVMHDWEQGLQYLAAAGDSALDEVIELDQRAQSATENPAEIQFTAADSWFSWQERTKGADRELVAMAKVRAHHWYSAAAPQLTGLNKIKADKRVLELAPSEAPPTRPVASATSPSSTQAAPGETTPTKKNRPTTKSRIPVPYEMETVGVCEGLQGKRPTVGVASFAEEFKAPNGDGRSGASGLAVVAGDPWKKQGTTWKFKYVFNNLPNGMKVVHPFQNGHLVVSMNHEKQGFGLNAGGNWSDVGWRMAGQRKIPFEITPEGQTFFPLANDTEYEMVSQLTADGQYGLFINKKLVAYSQLPNGVVQPLDLRITADVDQKPGTLFSGGSMPRVLKPGEALIIIGPTDNGVNKLTNIEFGPKPAEQ